MNEISRTRDAKNIYIITSGVKKESAIKQPTGVFVLNGFPLSYPMLVEKKGNQLMLRTSTLFPGSENICSLSLRLPPLSIIDYGFGKDFGKENGKMMSFLVTKIYVF